MLLLMMPVYFIKSVGKCQIYSLLIDYFDVFSSANYDTIIAEVLIWKISLIFLNRMFQLWGY